MKLAAKAVDGFLARPVGVAALCYGPDSGLARERAQQIIRALLGASPDPLSILDVEQARVLADPAWLADELSAVSFLSSQRVMLVRDASDKLTKMIEAAAEFLRPDHYLIVLADELTPRSSLRLWFEKSEQATALACYHDEARDIEAVVRQSFAQAGLSAAPAVIQYVAARLGNDRYVTRQELEKITLYAAGEKEVTLEMAQALVNDNHDTELDAVTAALADRSLKALDTALAALAREGVASMQVLRTLSRYFQRLYALANQAEQIGVEAAVSAARPPIFFKQVPHITRHVRRWKAGSIAQALSLINAAELACKTSDIPAFAASERELMKVTQIRNG